jgi:hypothetical protein
MPICSEVFTDTPEKKVFFDRYHYAIIGAHSVSFLINLCKLPHKNSVIRRKIKIIIFNIFYKFVTLHIIL